MNAIETAVEQYIAIWNETDDQRRRALIAQTFAGDATYTDPLADVRGVDDLNALVAGAQGRFAGLRFGLGGAIDEHHDIARFTWHLREGGAAEPMVVGFDVIVTSGGRIRNVYGFLDKVPAAV